MRNGILAVLGAGIVLGGAGLIGLGIDADHNALVEEVAALKAQTDAMVAERVELRTALLTVPCTPEPVPPPDLIQCWVWTCVDQGEGDPVCAWKMDHVPPGCAHLDQMVGVEVPDIQVSVKGKPAEVAGQTTHEVSLPTCMLLDLDGLCPSVEILWVEARTAYREGVTAREEEQAKCPGGVQTAPSGHGCLCMAAATEARVAGEAQAVADLAPADRVNLVVCCDHERARVLRLPAGEPLKPGCQSVGQPVTDWSQTGYETDFSRLMTAACAPCPGPGGAYCPQCLCQPGGCAEACPVVVEPK